MESHSHADDIITLPNDSQSGTQATSSSHLFVECPGICKRQVALGTVKLARESHSRAIWNCSSCRQIKKKTIKISWYNLVCVQCTHTHGKTCLIQTCARNCPTKRALDRKRIWDEARSVIQCQSVLSSALEPASGGLLSNQSISQEKAKAVQFGLAAVAVRSKKNKLRLGGITWCVFSALTHMVQHA